MFWILLILIGIILFFLGIAFDQFYFFIPISAILVIVGFILSFIMIVSGVSYFPRLKSKYTWIVVLETRIKNIEDIYYDGDISMEEDFKQSSDFSSFFLKFESTKRNYLEDLKDAIIRKKFFVSKFFGCGFFIHDEVLELPKN
jgi:hypothetical protein